MIKIYGHHLAAIRLFLSLNACCELGFLANCIRYSHQFLRGPGRLADTYVNWSTAAAPEHDDERVLVARWSRVIPWLTRSSGTFLFRGYIPGESYDCTRSLLIVSGTFLGVRLRALQNFNFHAT